MIPFTPGHKVTFEQLSKDLQDRFIQAQANLKEIEAKVEEAKKKINSKPITAESTTKIEKLKTDINEYNRQINNLIDTKVREINNANYTTPVTEYILGTGINGHWSKIDQQNKKLFGDDAFDVVLVYKNITSQEFTQLKTSTPTSISSKYGTLETRVRAAFDMALRKVYIHNGTTWAEETNTAKTNEYFSKYLYNRSFYVNPITKSLYFYYEPGNACLIGKGTDEEIGKIIGNINTIDRNKSMDMPLVKHPPTPVTPKISPEVQYRFYPRDRVLRNSKDIIEVGKFLSVPKMHKKPYIASNILSTIFSSGFIWATRKDKIETPIKTAYGGSAYVSMDKKFLEEAKLSTGTYYIPPLTAFLFDYNTYFDENKSYYNNSHILIETARKLPVTYEGLLRGQYDVELNRAASYVIFQKDFELRFIVSRQNGIIPPRYVIITGSPIKVNGTVLSKSQLMSAELPAEYGKGSSSRNLGDYDYWGFNTSGSPQLFDIYFSKEANNHIILDYDSIELTRKNNILFASFFKDYINMLSENYYNDNLNFSSYYAKNTVFAYDTEFNGNYISLKTDIRYLNFHKGAIINTNLSRCVIIGPSYLVPYIIGEGIPKSSLDMSFSINVWTGMDTLK
jgi:hypothetical protein